MSSESSFQAGVMPPPRYVAAPPDALIVRAVEDLHLVYDRRSGETHVLAADIFTILNSVGTQPRTPADALALLAAEHDIETETGEALDIVAARLSELNLLGLVDEAA